MDPSSSSDPEPNFHDFLNRMRNPASADLVRAIKSFIVSFSFHTRDSENDSRNLQDFLMKMKANVREHPLWIHCTDEEIDSAVEGLEKYVMTKLFNRTFASCPEDVKADLMISEKICLLQHFIKPDHLDVPKGLQNEASLLFAAKELQKINAFRAPREKLLCIMNCCRVINNLLLNLSLSTDHMPAGADDFLPILIYVTIRANPSQLHSNLKFIQLFRWRPKLVSEMEYYLTNLISAKSFIENIDASSLSMDVSEFEKNMQAARSAIKGTGLDQKTSVLGSSEGLVPIMRMRGKEIHFEGNKYPFMDKKAEDLTGSDVQQLLGLYKQVVTRYSMLSKALGQLNLNEDQLLYPFKRKSSSAAALNFAESENPNPGGLDTTHSFSDIV